MLDQVLRSVRSEGAFAAPGTPLSTGWLNPKPVDLSELDASGLDPKVVQLLRDGAWIEGLVGLDEEPLVAAVRERTRAEQKAAAFRLYLTLELRNRRDDFFFVWGLRERPALAALSRRKLGWTTAETLVLWEALLARLNTSAWRNGPEFVRLPLAAAEEARANDETLAPTLAAAVTEVRDRLEDRGIWMDNADRIRTRRRLSDLLPASDTVDVLALPDAVLPSGDSFGPQMRAELLTDFDPAVSVPLLSHLTAYAGGVTPTKTWRTKLAVLLREEPARAGVALRLLERVRAHQAVPMTRGSGDGAWTEGGFLLPETAVLLRASVWAARDSLDLTMPTDDRAQDGAGSVVATISEAAVWCGGGLGGAAGEPRCAQVTSSAIAALADLGTGGEGADALVAALARIQGKIRNRTLLKAADKALATIAARAGVTRSQLLERSVPALGLDAGGLTRRLGEHTATIAVTAAGVRLGWISAAGRAVRAVPKAVREQHGAELTELRTLVKEAEKVLSAERARLEDLLASGRTWTGEEWIRLYAGHPLTGVHAARLLWERTPGHGTRADRAAGAGEGGEWTAGLPTTDGDQWALRTLDDTLDRIHVDDTVRLWHPIRVGEDEVARWRARVQDAALRQPFKQVYREVYRLTPAEEATETYSNRYAGHILTYRQAGALMRTRGWVGNHLGYWDGGYEGEATREFSDTGWRATFYYDLVENEADRYGTPAYCATDQIRFTRLITSGSGPSRWERARMQEVPEIVLTEAMRDVDLFVGVTSIAADPQWIDRGTDRYRDYWQTTSFGELTESAQLRREALARLMPRTKIADRVRLTDRFLEVDGTRRTYKIHLGSGNILMSPNDTYLCIVVDRGADVRTGGVFLPFEEDGGLLSIIVSKAFLLAADDAIADTSILAQIARP